MIKKFIFFALVLIYSTTLHAQSPYGKVLTLDNSGTQQWIDIGTVLSTYTTYHTGNSSPSWLTNGNSITSGVFLGTTNNQPLIFKTNGIEHMRLLENGGIRLYNSTGANTITFQYSGSTNLTFTLPTSYGTSGQFLTTDGSGVLSWASASFTETDPFWSIAKSGTTTISGTWTFSNTITGSINGNAGTATALQTSRNFSLSGDVTASVVSFDGTGNVTLNTTIANNAVTTAKIVDGTIQNADISNSAGIAVSKLAPGSNGQVLQTVSGTPQWTTFSSGWVLTGNSGTNPSTNFIGTTDAAALQIKVNNQKSGWIDYTNPYNSAWGYQTLVNNTSGIANTACGYLALYSNTTGSYNTANGSWALYSNNTGFRNTASGSWALYSNTSGGYNTASGFGSLYSNTTSIDNTASGSFALYSNTTGSYNTAVGASAGYYITTGSNNICIGNDAQVPTPTADNQIRIGNTSITYAGVQVAWTITSDYRLKENISNSKLGLEFINKLRPVSYTRRNDKTQKLELGFIAQEVEKALKEEQIENTGLVSIADDGTYSLRYNDFIAPIVKSIQELTTQNEALKAANEQMKAQNEQMRVLNEQMRVQNEQMRAENEALKQRLERLEKYVFERTGSGDSNVGMK